MAFRTVGLRFLAVAIFGVYAHPVGAQEFIHEVKIGILSHDVDHMWSGFRREPVSADVNIEAQLSPFCTFLSGTVRPVIGGTLNTVGATSHVYTDVRWSFDLPEHTFAAIGLGGALHNGSINRDDPHSKALGSQLLFHIPVEFGIHLDDHRTVSAYFEHTSNANSQRFNEGLDRIGLRTGLSF